jgi:sugar phosphate isomerase/epimerase
LGIEVMNFAYPDVLDGDWQGELAAYQAMLEPVRQRGSLITLHGPFMDMAPGSPDKQIEGIVKRRYEHAIRITSALGGQIIVLHANFIAAILEDSYRKGWHQRNVEFWRGMAGFASSYRVTLAVENMWEFDPYIIADVLHEVDHPNLRACVDVGHAHLFSRVPFDEWLRTMSPFLVHIHMNNNDGTYDIHRALPDGVLNYNVILEKLRDLSANLPKPLSMTLEMDSVDDMRRSLDFFRLKDDLGSPDGIGAASVSKSDTAELPPVLVDVE